MLTKFDGKVTIVASSFPSPRTVRLLISQDKERSVDTVDCQWLGASDLREMARFLHGVANEVDRINGLPGKAQREKVYEIIDGERDYQDALGPDRTDGARKSVGDYLTMLQSYLNKAVAAWTDNAGNRAALEGIRKIAGIAVHCMEDHETPARKRP